jgi:hypothetical protein
VVQAAADDARLSVVLADAAEVAGTPLAGTVDALQVDLYDHEAAAPGAGQRGFLCRLPRLLTEDGCMTVNLFGRSSSYERSLAKMAAAFGEDAVWAFKPTREGNTVVLAQRTPPAPNAPGCRQCRNHPDSLGPARGQVAARFQTDFMLPMTTCPSHPPTATVPPPHRRPAGLAPWWNGARPTA